MKSIHTLIAFKLSWLAVVFGAVWSMEWIGLLAVSAFTAFEVFGRKRNWLLIPAIVVGVLGYAVDNAYVLTGLLRFNDSAGGIAPYWMALLWVNFALVVEHGLSWLQDRPIVGAVLGAIGGPMAYLAGVRLELITFVAPPLIAITIIALTWAAAMPLLMHFLSGPNRDETAEAISH